MKPSSQAHRAAGVGEKDWESRLEEQVERIEHFEHIEEADRNGIRLLTTWTTQVRRRRRTVVHTAEQVTNLLEERISIRRIHSEIKCKSK